MERALQEAQKATEGGGSGSGQMGGGMSEEQVEELEEEYGFDKPILQAYLQWLGALPRERRLSKSEFRPLGKDKVGEDLVSDPNKETLVLLKGSGRQAKIIREGNGTEVISATYLDNNKSIADDGWETRIETIEDRQERWVRRSGEDVSKAPQNYDDRAIVYKTRFAGLLQGDLGRSTDFGDPVWSLIKGRIPVALYFGILTALITYGVCLPLGILKAIKHRTWIDNLSSILVFSGYAIPGYVLGSFLLVFLGANLDLFPLSGFVSENFDELSTGNKILDLFHHAAMPLACYLVGSFAFMTFMMKNNLMDNLAADYVRTAISKGASYRTAVFHHAFRNSIIPIATTIGQNITLIVGGSFLIETIFDINGFGLLQYNAILEKDEPVVLGVLIISAALMLLGNIISDLCVAFVDPRIRFR